MYNAKYNKSYNNKEENRNHRAIILRKGTR